MDGVKTGQERLYHIDYKKLAENEKDIFIKHLFLHSTSGIAISEIVLDKKSKPIDFIVKRVNPAFEFYTIIKGSDVTGCSLKDVFPDIDITPLLNLLSKDNNVKDSISFKYYYKPLDKYFSINACKMGDSLCVFMVDCIEKTEYNKENKINGYFELQTDITKQKQLNNQLKESEERYRQLVEHSGSVIWECNEQGLCTYMSGNSEKVYGYKPEEIINRVHFYDLHPPSEREQLKSIGMNIIKNKENFNNLESKIITKDGREIWVLTSGVPLLNPDGTLRGYRSINRDITQLKKTELELRSCKEQFELAVRGSNDGIWDWDLRSNSLYLSPQWKAQLGYNDDEITNNFSSFESRLHPEDKPVVMEYVNQYLQGKIENYEQEFRLKHKDGSYRWFFSRGKSVLANEGNPVRMAGSHTDITERKKEEEKQYFQYIFQQAKIEISAEFITVKTQEELDSALNSALKCLGELFQVDRSYYFNFSDDLAYMTNTHEWCADGITAQIDRLANSPIDSMPWWKNEIFKKEPVHITNVEMLPPEADAEKKEFIYQGIKSLLCIPVIGSQSNLMGFMGFDSVRQYHSWSQHEISMLKVLETIVGSVIERIRTEKKLQKKTEELDQYFMSALDLLCIADTGGHFLRLNPQWEQVLGYSLEELQGRSFLDFVHPDDLEGTIAAISELSGQQEVLNFENRYRCKDGSYRWIQWRSKPQGTTIYAAARDITENRLMQEALKDSENRIRSYIENAPYGIFIADKKGKYIDVNPAACKMTGYSHIQLCSMSIPDILSPNSLKDGLESFRQVSEIGMSQSELTFLDKDGKECWWNVSAVKISDSQFIAFCNDITNQKIAAENLAKSIKEKQILLDNIHTQVWYLTDVNTYGAVNKAHADFAGFEPKYMENKALLDLFPAHVAHICREGNIKVFTEGEPVETEEWIPNASGEKRLLSIYKSPIINSEGKVDYVVCSAEDITERKLAEERLLENEKHFIEVLHSSEDAIILYDGTFVDCNEAAATMYGYNNREDLLGLHPGNLSPPIQPDGESSFKKADEMMKQAVEKGFVRFEWLHQRLNGECFPVEVTLTSIIYKCKNLIYAVCRDITDIKKTEEELSLKSQMLDQISDLVTITDLNGVITYVNQAELKTLKLSKEEIIGKKTYIYGEDETKGVSQREIFEQTLREGSGRFEIINYASDGSERVMDCRTLLLHNAKGKPIALCGITTDITERKLAEDKIKQNESFLRSIFDAIQDGISVLDKELNIVHANKAMQEWYPNVQLKGDKCYRAYHGRSDICEVCPSLRSLKSGRLEKEEVPYIKDGKEIGTLEVYSFPVYDKNEQISGVVEFVRNITERKNAEQQLYSEKTRLANIIEATNIGTWECNFQTGEIIVNTKWAEILGYNLNELSRSTIQLWWNNIHPDDYAEALAHLTEHMQGKLKLYDQEVRMKHKEGSWIWVQVRGRIISWTKEGKPLWMFGTLLDITQRRKDEGERLKLLKLESLSVLAGGIAHDFNNLLAGILGYSSLAQQELLEIKNYTSQDYDTIQNALDSIVSASTRAKGLSNQLLTFSKGDTVNVATKSLVSLSEIIKETVAFTMGSSSNAACKMNLPPDLWRVQADEGQIGQIIQNLTLNAIQAMPDGGFVTIRAENIEKQGKNQQKDFVHISIEDTGIGIPEKYLPKIFDPYFTTKTKDQIGSGLGLTASYNIVQKLGGSIEVESKPGIGSTFHVYLPAIKTAFEIDKIEDKRNEQNMIYKILVMDDDKMIRGMLLKLLKKMGHEAITSENGHEAIEKYTSAYKTKQPFDLVILDLTIPGGMGGKKTLEELKKINPNVISVISSGFSEQVPEGFSAVMPKPYTIKKLQETIEKVMHKQP